MDKDTYTQEGIQETEGKRLEDFFRIEGGILNLIGTMQTVNFVSGKRGVQIKNEGLNANGATISGATLGNALAVSSGGTGASSLTGILLGNGTSAVTTVAGVSGSFYAAATPGGSPTHLITVTNGVITNIA